AARVPGAFQQNGPAQGEWRHLSRPQRHRHQKPRRNRCRGLRLRGRSGLRHGASRVARQDRRDAGARSAPGDFAPDNRRGCLVTMLRSVVLGCGSYLPARVLTNADLSRMVDTSDEWIAQRTGIRERHIAAEGETTSDMALKAARAALTEAGIDAQS